MHFDGSLLSSGSHLDGWPGQDLDLQIHFLWPADSRQGHKELLPWMKVAASSHS